MVKFNLDTHPDKRCERPIRVSVRVAGTRFMNTIGYSISPDKWTGTGVEPGTKKNPTVSAKGIPATIINARIAAITAAFATIEATPGAATKEAYQTALDKIKGKTDRQAPGPKLPEVLAAFDTFVREESSARQWAKGTLQCWHAFRLHLQLFNEKLTFADLNEKGLARFVSYLRTTALGAVKAAEAQAEKTAAVEVLNTTSTKEVKAQARAAIRKADRILEEITKHPERNGLEEKTVKKHYTNLKWFLRWCNRQGYCNQRAFERFQPKFKVVEKTKVFLTRQELMKLYNYVIPANGTVVTLQDMNGNEYTKTVREAGGLAKARDLFCFLAFTSLRISDLEALKRTNIVGNTIIVTTQKTHDRLEIPLNDYSRAILDKYAGYQDPEGHPFPVIAPQNINYYLRDLCELCGFNTPITKTFYRGGQRVEETKPKWSCISTHAGRKTFICYALTIGIPPQVVMKWTGHSDYKAMKPYIDIAATDAAAAMEKFNKSMAL